MIRSMTGFGRGFAENRLGAVKIEIKSLNYKFFEVVNRLPANLTVFEDDIREYLQKRVSRGRLNLFLSFDRKSDKQGDIYIDKKSAKQYYNMLAELKGSLGLSGKINLTQMISLPGVIAHHSQEEDMERLWPLIEKALNLARTDLMRSKEEEGRSLKKNLKHIVESIERSLSKIKGRTPMVVRDYKERLFKDIKNITGSKRIFNPERIEEEVAIFARNCDITEEVQRISSHISVFEKALSNNGEVGRRLDFIAQEIYRETNTIGAKANDFPISKEVIKIKSLVEKIREQVQNVE